MPRPPLHTTPMPPKSAARQPKPTSAESPDGGRLAAEQGPEIKRPRAPARPRKATRPALEVTTATDRTGAEPGASAARTSTPPIIVATADPSLGRMLSFALDQMRLQYRMLDSGSLTLRALLDMPVGAQRPLVVLDVDLPGVDGHAILERLGVDRPDTFLILVLSSHADESVQVRSLLAGALDHLAKPFNVRVLMAKIQRWVAISAHLPGAA